MNADSDTKIANKTLTKFHTMPRAKHFKAFRKLPQSIQHLITDECKGEAHSNAYIDHCGVCLNYTWGRTLKANPVK